MFVSHLETWPVAFHKHSSFHCQGVLGWLLYTIPRSLSMKLLLFSVLSEQWTYLSLSLSVSAAASSCKFNNYTHLLAKKIQNIANTFWPLSVALKLKQKKTNRYVRWCSLTCPGKWIPVTLHCRKQNMLDGDTSRCSAAPNLDQTVAFFRSVVGASRSIAAAGQGPSLCLGSTLAATKW